ncbi:hypothetical protein [Luteimicrobium sp. DT211]|uniref:hypothetical protein n=1 Tax=Luteimicrobium sp. DT211 TaxID=3393412 RepID=UPI003CEABDEE
MNTAAGAAVEQRRRVQRLWLVVGSGILGLAIVTAVTAVAVTNPGGKPAPKGATSAPPWPAPTDPAARAKASGLRVAPMEGAALHIHQHLTVSVDGSSVEVPANLGVDPAAGGMSPLHTHDTSGIVHVESPKVATFTLGQVFAEWGVALGTDRVGGYVDGRNGRHVAVFVDGKLVTTAFPNVRLQDHQDIAVVITRGSTQPAAPATSTWANAE